MTTQKLILYVPCIDKAGIRGILRNARRAKPMKGYKNNHGLRSPYSEHFIIIRDQRSVQTEGKLTDR